MINKRPCRWRFMGSCYYKNKNKNKTIRNIEYWLGIIKESCISFLKITEEMILSTIFEMEMNESDSAKWDRYVAEKNKVKKEEFQNSK